VIFLAAVDDDAIWAAMASKRLSKKTLCSRQVTVFAEEELDRVANTIDGTVEIHTLAAHFDATFVKVPLVRDGALALVETLQQLGREVNDPAVNGRNGGLRTSSSPKVSRDHYRSPASEEFATCVDGLRLARAF